MRWSAGEGGGVQHSGGNCGVEFRYETARSCAAVMDKVGPISFFLRTYADAEARARGQAYVATSQLIKHLLVVSRPLAEY